MSSNGGPGRDAAVGVAVGGVVDEPAGLADPLLHGGALAHVALNGTGQAASRLRRRGRRSPRAGRGARTDGEVTVPRQAATVIVLRGGAETLEVLLVQRNPAARFMGGAWVFPGGAVDADEGEGDGAHRAAAVRELDEEAGDRGRRPGAAGALLALDHAARGQDPLRHALLPRRAARRRAAARSTATSASTSAGSRPQAALGRLRRAASCCSSSPRSSTSSSCRAFASADELLAFATGREVVAGRRRAWS